MEGRGLVVGEAGRGALQAAEPGQRQTMRLQQHMAVDARDFDHLLLELRFAIADPIREADGMLRLQARTSTPPRMASGSVRGDHPTPKTPPASTKKADPFNSRY